MRCQQVHTSLIISHVALSEWGKDSLFSLKGYIVFSQMATQFLGYKYLRSYLDLFNGFVAMQNFLLALEYHGKNDLITNSHPHLYLICMRCAPTVCQSAWRAPAAPEGRIPGQPQVLPDLLMTASAPRMLG